MKRRLTALVVSALLIGGTCLASAGPGVAATPRSAAATAGTGTWTSTANGLSLVRYSFRATTLPDGRVLVEGGFAPGSYTTEAETYDPAANAWTVINPMHQGRGEQTATLLTDGRVLVAGGYAGPVLSSAEVFDPSTGQWQVTGSMNVNRTRQAAVRLCDGRVLVVGGWNGQELTSAEIYDPSSGVWTMTPGSLAAPVSGLEAFLLPDCTVLVAGGGAGSVASAAAYIFHADTGMFTATASMHYARAGLSGVELPDGRVLVMGGNTPDSSTTAEEFDPATQQWSDMAPMHDPHTLGTGEEAQLLPGGQVLVPGDSANGLEAELYDPAANTWSFTGPQNAVHYGGVTALLNDGRVLNAGGMDSSRTLTAIGETYAPAPTGQVISFTGPTSGVYGGSVTLTATGGASGNPVVFTVDPSSSGVCAVSGTNGSTLSYTGTGSCVIDANQVGGSGYGPAPQVQQTFTVDPAPLTITASSATTTYGSQAPAITPSYSGFVIGDSPASLATQPSCSTTVTSASPAGAYPSDCRGAADPNYQISYVSGSVTVQALNYMAMGDSFSSGEGNPPFVLQGTDTDTQSDHCHRSPVSYPWMLASGMPGIINQNTFTDVACSGATVADVTQGFPANHEDPQLNHLTRTTNLVTITIGGDDVDFEGVLLACIKTPVSGSNHCQTSQVPDPNGSGKLITLDQRESILISNLASEGFCQTPSGYIDCNPSLHSLYKDIAARAPDAHIIVMLYPHLFTNDPAPGGCILDKADGNIAKVSKTNVIWLNAGVDELDAQIISEVRIARDAGVKISWADPRPAWNDTMNGASPGGHGVCTSQPWLYGPIPDNNPAHFVYSFHPNLLGQTDFESEIRLAKLIP
jgi:hypothetical protein